VDVHERAVFSDRGRRIVALLRQFHLQTSGAPSGHAAGVRFVFTRHFDRVWEEMLRSTLVPMAACALPRGCYRPRGGGLECEGLHLRPDVVIAAKAGLFVLDAKDYGAANWPASDDVSKQILYRLMLAKSFHPGARWKLDSTHNAFLFPAPSLGGRGAQVRGVHLLEDDPYRWGDIVGLDVDYERVAKNYVAGRADSDLRAAIVSEILHTAGAGRSGADSIPGGDASGPSNGAPVPSPGS
jgi:hypothetical protein